MDYSFDENMFISSFNAKSDGSKSLDSMRLTHKRIMHLSCFHIKQVVRAKLLL